MKQKAMIVGIWGWRDLGKRKHATIATVEVIEQGSALLNKLGLVEEKILAEGGTFTVSVVEQ